MDSVNKSSSTILQEIKNHVENGDGKWAGITPEKLPSAIIALRRALTEIEFESINPDTDLIRLSSYCNLSITILDAILIGHSSDTKGVVKNVAEVN